MKWRQDLKKFHAEKSANILGDVGSSQELIDAVQLINLKKDQKNNVDVQLMEDALCMVFLEFQFDALIAKTDDEKMIVIIQKTWAKMSDFAHEKALGLTFSEKAGDLVQQALAG